MLGIDLFDGILILDIKFYLFYLDVIIDVMVGFVDIWLEIDMSVEFSDEVLVFIEK